MQRPNKLSISLDRPKTYWKSNIRHLALSCYIFMPRNQCYFFFHLSKPTRSNVRNLGRIRGLWTWITSDQLKISFAFLAINYVSSCLSRNYFPWFYSKNIQKSDIPIPLWMYIYAAYSLKPPLSSGIYSRDKIRDHKSNRGVLRQLTDPDSNSSRQ